MISQVETLLLTGFEPFGGVEINPSWEIARALEGEMIEGARLVARCLPVEWGGSWPALQRAIIETEPRWVLMLGVAGKRALISVERVGRNVCDELADNSGQMSGDTLIATDGPEMLPSSLPVEKMVAAIYELGLPVELSESAGGYLCNHTLYNAMLWAAKEAEPPAIGFVHVPPLPTGLPDPGGARMTLDDMVLAVRAAAVAVVRAG